MANQYLGQVFGDYKLIKYLGEGGFADVYLGQHVVRKRKYLCIMQTRPQRTTRSRHMLVEFHLVAHPGGVAPTSGESGSILTAFHERLMRGNVEKMIEGGCFSCPQDSPPFSNSTCGRTRICLRLAQRRGVLRVCT